MKTFKILSFLLISLVLLCACEEEANQLDTEVSNLEISMDNENEIKQIVNEMITQAEAMGKVSYATLMYDGKNYLLEELSFSQVKKQEMQNAEVSGQASNFRSGTITITCTFGDVTSESTTCPSGDFLCIGVAVQGCINSGGCAETCRQVITYVPYALK